MTQYRYIDSTGAVKGPITFEELTRLRAAGEVTDATLVQAKPDGEWIKLSEIPLAENPPTPTPDSDDGNDEVPSSDEPRYFVWTGQDKAFRPLTIDEIRDKLLQRIIERHFLTARDVGQGAKAARASKNPQTVGDLLDAKMFPITRRSRWATFSFLLAAISAFVSLLGFIALLSGKPAGLAILFAGASQCVFFLFLAFIINVLTDIRWLLSNLVEETRKS